MHHITIIMFLNTIYISEPDLDYLLFSQSVSKLPNFLLVLFPLLDTFLSRYSLKILSSLKFYLRHY